MLAPWQRPELFLGEMIRHNLTPAEDRNTKQTAIGFANAHCRTIIRDRPENPPWHGNCVGMPRKLAKDQERMLNN
jgi:hypothetical protein